MTVPGLEPELRPPLNQISDSLPILIKKMIKTYATFHERQTV